MYCASKLLSIKYKDTHIPYNINYSSSSPSLSTSIAALVFPLFKFLKLYFFLTFSMSLAWNLSCLDLRVPFLVLDDLDLVPLVDFVPSDLALDFLEAPLVLGLPLLLSVAVLLVASDVFCLRRFRDDTVSLFCSEDSDDL